MSNSTSSSTEETMRLLLGLSLEEEDTTTKPAKKGTPSAFIEGAISATAKLLRKAEKNKWDIDDVFHHEHCLYSCDGLGAFYIVSSFTVKNLAPGMPQLSAIVGSVVRCHDNYRDSFFLPTEARHSEPNFRRFLEDRRNDGGIDFRPVSYTVCKTLIVECLQRMETMNKRIPQHMEARTVARLYGLPTKHPFHSMGIALPDPKPAPSVETLWIVLNRPEYYFFSFNEDLYNDTQWEGGKGDVIDPNKLSKCMRCISRDRYRRNRLYAMLEHMARWHAVGGEHEVASWLLWERASMVRNVEDSNDTAIMAMEENVLFQLAVNKYFDEGIGLGMAPRFGKVYGKYGEGLTNYLLYQQDLEKRGGKLPPNVLLTASVISKDGSISAGQESRDSNTSNNPSSKEEDVSVSRLSKRLAFCGCAICGATKAKKTKGKLLSCARCNYVQYCCKEHQVLHWKKGNHKQECVPREG